MFLTKLNLINIYKWKKKRKKKKNEKVDGTKGILAGIGASLGIVALGIGGKLMYDKYKKKETPNEKEEFSNFKNVDNFEIIEKLKKQKTLKPKIINDEYDKNYIRANSIQTKDEDEEELIKKKNSFICPIKQMMMENPVITPYGTTYEKSAILDWINKNNNDYLTKKPLNKDMIIPNYILKSSMMEYNESLKL